MKQDAQTKLKGREMIESVSTKKMSNSLFLYLQEVKRDLMAVQRKMTIAKELAEKTPGPHRFTQEDVDKKTRQAVQRAIQEERAKITYLLQQRGWSLKAIGELFELSGCRVKQILNVMFRRARRRWEIDNDITGDTKKLRELRKLDKQETLNELRAGNWRLDLLNVSVRTENSLYNANIRTLLELVEKTELELLASKNFGRKSLREVRELLKELGLELGMSKADVKERLEK